MQGVEQLELAVCRAPAEMQPLLTGLLALFQQIGRSADGSANEIGVDLDEVWGLAAA